MTSCFFRPFVLVEVSLTTQWSMVGVCKSVDLQTRVEKKLEVLHYYNLVNQAAKKSFVLFLQLFVRSSKIPSRFCQSFFNPCLIILLIFLFYNCYLLPGLNK